jgi:CheY-like chemotaxis protein
MDEPHEGSRNTKVAESPRILLAEDNISNQGLIKTLLQRKGWQVVTVSTGNEVLDTLATLRVDLILMDIQMPDLNGLETTRIIRNRQDDISRIPIVGLSAASFLMEREKCQAAGMNDFIAKPFKASHLYATIEKYLTGSTNHGS